MTRERMRHADAAWLRMDSPTNLMVVNSVLWFDEPLDETALRAVVAERLVGRFRRFRQRAVEDGGTWWEDDEDFDVSRHLHHVALPEPRDRRSLEDLVASYLTVPLDRDRPLWDLYIVDDYDGGSALFFRMHHAIADGIALTRVLLSLTDGGERYEGVATDDDAEDHHGLLSGIASFAAHELVESATHPWHLVDLAAATVADVRALGKLVVLPPAGRFWERRTGPGKQVTWSEPVPLERVKRIGQGTGTTVNDVLLAAVAGALRLERERVGQDPGDLRVVVPFNLRSLDEPLPTGLGNAFGLVFLSLPVGCADPAARLRSMAERMRAIKQSAEGVVSYGVLDVVGRAPSVVEKGVVEVFAAKAGAVMTNVAGPRAPVTLAGTRLAGTIGWVPMSGSIGVGVSIFSYDGEVVIGLSVDRLQLEDPHRLLEDVLGELDRLEQVAEQ